MRQRVLILPAVLAAFCLSALAQTGISAGPGGTITMSGGGSGCGVGTPCAIAAGGTGQTTAPAALTALGAFAYPGATGIPYGTASNTSRAATAADLTTLLGFTPQAALGFTPLNPANNLSDVSTPTTALKNLGGAAWLTGTGAPAGTCSSTVNTGAFYTNQLNSLYQCSNIVGGTYQWNLIGTPQVYPASGIPNSTGTAWGTSYTAQGTDTKLMTAGTVSGTGSGLCTDSNGGATTSGCSFPGGGVPSVNGITSAVTVNGRVTTASPNVTVYTQRGKDALADANLVAGGVTDNSSALSTWLNSTVGSNGAPELWVPCGVYYFHSTVSTNASGVKIIGEGTTNNIGTSGCVTFETDQQIGLLWFDNTNSASNLAGPEIRNIQFVDSSAGHNQMLWGLRITNYANAILDGVGALNLYGQDYTTGTVSISNGSTTWSFSGATLNANMMGGFVHVDGRPFEITAVNVAGGTVTTAVQYNGSTLVAAAYSISYGGKKYWFDPGLGFTQYIDIWNDKSHCVQNLATFSSGAMSSEGTSRIKFHGGYSNGCSATIADSLAIYGGHYSDTVRPEIKLNSFAYGVVVADGHQWDITGMDWENASGTTPIVPTCPGSPSYACGVGVLIYSDNASDTYGNRVVDNYLRQAGSSQGTGIWFDGISGQYPTMTILNSNTSRSLLALCNTSNSTNTIGGCSAPTITVSIPSFAVPANTCYGSSGSTTPATATMNNVEAGHPLDWGYTGNASGITGWGTSGGLYLNPWASAAGTASYLVCNPGPASITGGAISLWIGPR